MAEGRGAERLNLNEWGTLRSFAKNNHTAAGAVARNLLYRYKNEYYPIYPARPLVNMPGKKIKPAIPVIEPVLTLYPNPNDGSATIQYALKDPTIPGSIIITDIVGTPLNTYEVSEATGQLSLNDHALSGGIYLCTLMQGDKKIAVQKFVKF